MAGRAHVGRELYILGAGFSKSLSPTTPTMKNLSTELLEADLSSHTYLARYVEEYRAAIDKSSDHYTIESICSALFGTELYRDVGHEHFVAGARIEFLRWLSHNIRYGRTAPADQILAGSCIDPERATVAARLLRRSSVESADPGRSLPARIITLNYDLLVESVLGLEERWSWCCDYHVRLLRYRGWTDAPEALVLPYLKLHGSLNWFRAAGADRNDVAAVVEVPTGSMLESMHRHDPPVFVPMAHARRAFLAGTLFPTLWRVMCFSLDQAEAIHFIGYGFPPTDLNLLLEFARQKDKVKTVVIHETEAEFSKKQRRFTRLFPNATVVNCDAMEYLAAQTQGGLAG